MSLVHVETCFAGSSNMPRRITARQSLLALQDISADCSDGESSDSELNDGLVNDVEEQVDSSGEDSDNDSDCEDSDSDSDQQNPVQANQDFTGKDGMAWQAMDVSHVQRGRLQQQNILNFKPSPTAFATHKVSETSPLSSFRVVFDEPMLRNIRKCTVAEAHRVSGSTHSLRTARKLMCLILILLLMNNYSLAKQDVGLFSTCRINQISSG